MAMRVVIAGAGRVGRAVAQTLSGLGDDVSVIDERPEAFDAFGKSFDGTFHTGVAYDVDTLREAGVDDADVFLAVTDSDNANLMAAQVAGRVFRVGRAIARLDDPRREDAYRALGVTFVAGAYLVAKVMVEMIHEPEFDLHVEFASDDVQIVDMTIGAAGDGLTVGRLQIGGSLRVAAVQRGDRVIVPSERTRLQRGDVVVGAARRGVTDRIRRYLTGEA